MTVPPRAQALPGYLDPAWSSMWIQRHSPGATSRQTRRIGRGGGGAVGLRWCGRTSTRRSLVIVEIGPRDLVVETVGLVIGSRLLGEWFLLAASRLAQFGSAP
jgi:hypothetical protein